MAKGKPFEEYIGEVIELKLSPAIARLESLVAQLNEQKKMIAKQFDPETGLKKMETRDEQ